MERSVAPANEEATEAWNGVLFDRFVQFRDIVVAGLGAHGEKALELFPPRSGDKVIDIGCGFGDTAQRLAELVGPEGDVLGVDVAERFIESAQAEAEEAGIPNVRFAVADVQVGGLEQGFDYAFSRFGTMFFANPVAALRNVRHALKPGGRLCMVVWRRKLDNPWLHRAELAVEEFQLERTKEDEPTCGPGPFSMADADTTSDVLMHAGFEDIALQRLDLDFYLGATVDGAVDYAMALGPAAEAIRLAGDDAEHIRPQIVDRLRDALAEYANPDGVRSMASTWIVTATAPAA